MSWIVGCSTPATRKYGTGAEAGLVIITKDEDFALRRNLASTGPTIVWIRKGSVRNAMLLAWFGNALPALLDALQRDEPIIELY